MTSPRVLSVPLKLWGLVPAPWGLVGDGCRARGDPGLEATCGCLSPEQGFAFPVLQEG